MVIKTRKAQYKYRAVTDTVCGFTLWSCGSYFCKEKNTSGVPSLKFVLLIQVYGAKCIVHGAVVGVKCKQVDGLFR